MKQMKMMMMALVAVVALSLTSCMNSDSSNSYDGYSYATVSGGMMGTTLYLDGTDIVLIPNNPSALIPEKATEPVKRAFVYYSFLDGEKYTEGKKQYNVSIVGGHGIPTAGVNLRPDTLKNAYTISDFSAWGAKEYLQTNTAFYPSEETAVLALYIDTARVDVSKNLLPLILRLDKGGDKGSQQAVLENSWDITSMRVRGLGLNPNDSVSVQITANTSATTPKVLKFKYKFSI